MHGPPADAIPDDAEPLREPESEQQRRTSERRLSQMAATVETWRPLLGEPIVPAPGSSLARDDEAFPDYSTSQVAWTGIRSAIDALDMFFSSLAADSIPHESGHRALARAGLTGAALALFVLAGDRPTRTHNALRAAWDDAEAYQRALADLRAARWPEDADDEDEATARAWGDTLARLDRRRDSLLTAADAAGLSRGALRKAPTFREIVDYAGAHIPNSGGGMPGALRMSLAQLNAASHSLRWHTVLTATHVIEHPHGTRARIVTTATDLFMSVGGAMTLLSRAVDLFRSRATPHV